MSLCKSTTSTNSQSKVSETPSIAKNVECRQRVSAGPPESLGGLLISMTRCRINRVSREEVTSMAMGGRSQKVRSTLVELLNGQKYFWEEQAALEFLPR